MTWVRADGGDLRGSSSESPSPKSDPSDSSYLSGVSVCDGLYSTRIGAMGIGGAIGTRQHGDEGNAIQRWQQDRLATAGDAKAHRVSSRDKSMTSRKGWATYSSSSSDSSEGRATSSSSSSASCFRLRVDIVGCGGFGGCGGGERGSLGGERERVSERGSE